jgi:SAM-dependent methyltransferase
MPEAYEQGLVEPVFRPFAVDLARRVSARSPRRVLEVAAGTGVLTRELVAALPAADITATDLNESMVDLGRERAPGARWRHADAVSLPFEDGRFDVLACQFGVMFFPHKHEAFAEARRVLSADGAFLFNVWDTLETHDFQAALVAGLHRAFPDDPPTFMESLPHGYTDVEVVVADVERAGLRCHAVESVTLVGRAASAAQLAVGYCTGTPVLAEIEARGDLAETIDTVTREMERQLGSGPVSGTMAAHVIEAGP